ncbi:MAG: hypothetical protein K2J30_03205, partial [Clostridia bacterium]|nr:hypothetical protein [Clostridia bacterium]
LISRYSDYDFINCTESPIEELSYTKTNGLYYRKIQTGNVLDIVDKANYIQSYKADNLAKQGWTLEEYIEACLLCELGEIKAVSKSNAEHNIEVLMKLVVCPDGLEEIHIECDKEIFDVISQIKNH